MEGKEDRRKLTKKSILVKRTSVIKICIIMKKKTEGNNSRRRGLELVAAGNRIGSKGS